MVQATANFKKKIRVRRDAGSMLALLWKHEFSGLFLTNMK